MITKTLNQSPDAIAPDGSEVRLLASTARSSMAHFRLLPGQTSQAVVHRSVEEIWFVVSGLGEIWRHSSDAELVTPLLPGVSLTIPVGTRFQFRNTGDAPLDIVGCTMPPWPGAHEAQFTQGCW